MAVAFDAFSVYQAASNPSGTHTPGGTPVGAVIWIETSAGTDTVTSANYGGVNAPEVANSPVLKNTGETMSAHCFFLGAGLPTGAQTVAAVTSGSARMCTITMTGNSDTVIVNTATISSDSLLNPAVTVALTGLTCFVAIGFLSGQDAVTGITPFSGWTAREENDFGTITSGIYTYDTVSTADVSAGWTATAEDAAAIAVAVTESGWGPLLGGLRSAAVV